LANVLAVSVPSRVVLQAIVDSLASRLSGLQTILKVVAEPTSSLVAAAVLATRAASAAATSKVRTILLWIRM
jgi:hypothetical protein